MLNKLFLTTSLIFAAVGFASTGYGQCQTSGQPRWGHGPMQQMYLVQNLFQAVDFLVTAQAAPANSYTSRGNMRRAYYKIAYVKMTLESSGCYEGLQALQVAIEKLNDQYLSARERIAEALKCLSIGAPQVIKSLVPAFRATNMLIRLALKYNEPCLFEEVVNVLRVAQQTAGQVGRAVEPIGVAIQKATDPYLSGREKYAFVVDCLNVARQQLRRW